MSGVHLFRSSLPRTAGLETGGDGKTSDYRKKEEQRPGHKLTNGFSMNPPRDPRKLTTVEY
jgi:hypothetical protein